MKINLKFNYKTFIPFILKRFSLVLWVFLGLVIIAEGFTIKSSVSKILQANDDHITNGVQLLRVNFGVYSDIDKRLTANSNFVPSEPPQNDPFGIVEKK